MAEIKLDTDEMAKLAQEAIFKSLSEDAKSAMIVQAISFLMKRGEGYGNRTSPFEDAFQHAVRGVAMKIAREALEKDPRVETEMKKLLAEALDRCFTTKREKVIESLVSAIDRALMYRES